MIVPVNFWAVLLSAVLAMVVGFLWYGPLFGKFWMRLRGKDPHSMDGTKMPITPMIVQFVSSLIIAFFVAEFAVWVGAVGVVGVMVLVFWLWLGFVATHMLDGVLWGGESWSLFAFDAAQRLFTLLVMAIVIGLWQ